MPTTRGDRFNLGLDQHRLGRRVDHPRLDPVQVEHIAEQQQQPLCGLLRDGQRRQVQLAPFGLLLHHFLQADNGVQRSTDLMAHGGQKDALGLVGRFGLLPRQRQLAFGLAGLAHLPGQVEPPDQRQQDQQAEDTAKPEDITAMIPPEMAAQGGNTRLPLFHDVRHFLRGDRHLSFLQDAAQFFLPLQHPKADRSGELVENADYAQAVVETLGGQEPTGVVTADERVATPVVDTAHGLQKVGIDL